MAKTGIWTWLVYMAGDNNLQGAGSTDLAEMKRVGSTDDVNVIVQFDTKANKTTRYRVEKNKLKTLAIDCGSHDYLDNQELRAAVTKALPGGRKLDIFACDACLMNMLEIAYEMQDTARFMVGSEETEPGAGWPYAAILKPLVAKPAMTPADLAKLIVVEYRKSFQRTGDAVTQSALDLGRVSVAAAAVNGLADLLLADLSNVAGAVTLARDRAQKFEMPEYIDLGDFAAQLARRLPQNAKLQTAVRDIQVALDPGAPGAFVIQNATTGAKMARATGVSIYFPHPEDYAPDYRDLRFSQQGRWKTFLEALFKA
jgi:hypothetical protein